MDVKYVGVAIVAVLAGVIYSNSAAVERALMQALSQSTAAQRLAVLYTQGTNLSRCSCCFQLVNRTVKHVEALHSRL